jgi:hypothetical protein
MNIVKVKYFTNGELSAREYTYFSVDPLKVGDIIIVPIRDTTGKAKVSAVDVPEAEIAAFRDKVKTIPSGSIVLPTATFTMVPDASPETKEALKEMAEKAVDMIKAEHDGFTDPAVQARYEAAIAEELPALGGNQTAMLRIAPEKDDKIVALYNEGLNLLQLAQGREVRSDADVRLATDDLAVIGGLRKKLDELKREYEEPFKEHLAAFREAFIRFTQPLVDADRINREKWMAYRRAVEVAQHRAEETNRMAQEVARRQAEESGTGEITVDTTPVAAPQAANTVRSTLGTSSAYKIPKYRILDFKVLPDEYKLPDAGKITRVIKAAKGQIVIPGVEIFFEETLAVRQR